MPYVETDGGLWWLSDEVIEQMLKRNMRETFCGLPVVWQDERQEAERVDYSVNRAERRRRKRKKPDQF